MRGPKVFPHAGEYCLASTILLAVIALGAVLLSGCGVSDSYVKSDRLVYEQVAPSYRDYVQADGSLTVSQKQRRLRTVTAWDARITQAEK